MSKLQFPIGVYHPSGDLSAADIDSWIDEVRRLPAELRAVVVGLPPPRLERRYRPGGWTAREVVHHIADSHTQGYLRFKWTLTEDAYVARSYDERAYMGIGDCPSTPVDLNLAYIDALHGKLVILFETMQRADFDRRMVHPDLGTVSLGEYLGRLAWHGRHHVAHVRLVAGGTD